MTNQISTHSESGKPITGLSKLNAVFKKIDRSNWFYNRSLSLDKASDTTVIELHGVQRHLTKKELLLLAIESNPSNCYALNNLANLLSLGEQVDVLFETGGQSLSRIQLLQLAIQCNPAYANAFCNLGVAMERLGLSELQIDLEGKLESLTPRLAYLKALELDSSHSTAYNNLALCLADLDESVSIRWGSVELHLNAQALWIKAIQSNLQNAEAFYNLSTTLRGQHETICISINSEELIFNKQSLLVCAIQADPNHSNAYFNLAVSLYERKQEAIDIEVNGLSVSHDEKLLYAKAIASNNQNAKAYYNLGLLLEDEQVLTLFVSGRAQSFTKIDLFKAAIQYQPDFLDAYFKLAFCLKTLNSTVDLLVGNKPFCLSKFEILELVLNRDPNHALALQQMENSNHS